MRLLGNKSLPVYLALVILLIQSITIAQTTRSQARPSPRSSASSSAPSSVPKIQFEKYTLPNGLSVILHVDRKLPIVHVNEWFHVGSKNERAGRSGFADLFEHMMFQGSKNADKEYFTYVEKAGANLFEDKGYSYGVFSFPILYSKSGAWVASGGVQTNKTKESVQEFVKELKHLSGDKPISDNELAHAKANRIRGYAQQFESLGRIAGQIAGLWAAGLPMTELQRETAELGKTTLSSVNAMAQKYALPKGSTLLLVGDLSKVESGVRELKLGEIVILDAEGKPVKK